MSSSAEVRSARQASSSTDIRVARPAHADVRSIGAVVGTHAPVSRTSGRGGTAPMRLARNVSTAAVASIAA
jgi:hypothetical protein